MRRILAILVVLSATFSLGIKPALAVQTSCYCRYASTHADFNSNANAKIYCPSEVYFWGLVDAGAGSTAAAIINCQSKCSAAGTNFVAIQSSKLDFTDRPNQVDLVTLEDEQCPFTPYDLSTKPTHWESGYVGCKEPLNSVAGKPWPEACSFCFCKYKKTPSVPDSCVGKFTMVHATSAPQECPALCGRLGLDPAGPGTQSYSDACDFSTSDGCASPRNINGQGCKTQQENAAIVKKNVLSSGSVVTMPLPLSNTSIQKVISRVISAILGIVGALALALFVWGGMSWMLAAGDSAKIGKAKQTIVWAALGLIAIFSSYAVLNFVINALT